MGGCGWSNPFPLELGGGATNVERIYRALRSAVGIGGSAEDDDGSIDGLWRQARASGLAAAATTGERALLNAFPSKATDLLEYYEALLGILPVREDDLPGRRALAAQRFTRQVDVAVPQLLADLQRIDPRFSILETPRAQAIETLFGRAFEDYAAAEPFGGGRKSTLFANYSTDFVVWVLFDIGSGVLPGPAEDAALEAAAGLLGGLPTWVNFQTATADGFILDESLLDLTGL